MEVFIQETTNETKTVDLSSLNSRENRNGNMYFIVAGVMGGATVTLTIASDASTRFAPITNGAITETGVMVENVPEECLLRVAISGATGTTDIDFSVR